ncbi:MAG: preprotein translocase subunit SecG [Christensenellales bacterium]|jgi:preprotein translocase subunit SecG
MSAVTIIIDIVLIVVSILLIVTVLLQQGQRQGLGAIGGGAETFFGKNKAKSYEGKLATLTKVCAAVFIVLAIVATIVTGSENRSLETVLPSGSVDPIVLDTEAPDTGEVDDAAAGEVDDAAAVDAADAGDSAETGDGDATVDE